MACDHSTNPPGDKVWKCALPADSTPAFSTTIGCQDDYRSLAFQPLDVSIPGALAVKTVIDRADGDRLYFLDTRKYRVHWEFASEHLSGNGKPVVPSISQFGLTEYYTPDRRFILGTLARYDARGTWAWEMTPSDNASAGMIELAYRKIAEACYCGKDLQFHANSLAIEAEAVKLPASVKVLSTAKLYEGVDYQPLNQATGFGRLVFTTADRLAKERVGSRGIVVLDAAPDDIPVVGGIITQAFQTPLSHINVLSQDRGTPNMGLRGAQAMAALRALEGKWTRLEVGPFGYSITEATEAEADAWFLSSKPAPLPLPAMDTTVRELADVEDILDLDARGLGEALKGAIAIYGGKTGHFSAFPRMDRSKVRYEPSFGIPFSHYRRHMRENGLDDTLERLLADPAFMSDPGERERRLESLREAVKGSPIDPAFLKQLSEKLEAKFPGDGNILFRSSANAENLDGYTGAGLYESTTGRRADPSHPVEEALLELWASLWEFRAFEERSYRNIDHRTVGMAVLVQAAHPGVKANGAALTANPFDPAGLEPGFYVNAQVGEASVTRPDPSHTPDQFIYHYDITGKPIVFMARSNLTPAGTRVLTEAQTYALGTALKEVHLFFHPLYGMDFSRFYAMEADFGLGEGLGDPPGSDPVFVMRQVRRSPSIKPR